MDPNIISAFSALGVAIAALWVRVEKTFRKVERKLDECEKDRAKLWERLAQ